MSSVIYSRPGCRYTEAAKREMDERGEPYEERDILSAPPPVRELAALSDGTFITPVIVQEDGVMRLGFGGV